MNGNSLLKTSSLIAKLTQAFNAALESAAWMRAQVKSICEWPVFTDLADAQDSVANYFYYYNHDRLHSSIDYQTPYRIHQQLLQTTALNCPA